MAFDEYNTMNTRASEKKLLVAAVSMMLFLCNASEQKTKAEGTVPVSSICHIIVAFSRDKCSYGDERDAVE